MAIRVSNITGQVLLTTTELFKSVSDIILFEHECERRTIRISNFTIQVLQLEDALLKNVYDTLSLDDDVFQFVNYGERKIASSNLGLTDSVTSPSFPQIYDTISFSELVRVSIFNLNIYDILGLHGSAGFCFGAPWTPLEIEDTIAFVSFASRIPPLSISNTITFTSEAIRTASQESQFIDFTQVVTAGKSTSVLDVIAFTDDIDSNNEFLRTIVNADIIRHAMTYYIDNGCNRKNYAPFVGEGSSDGISAQRLTWDANMALESMSGDLLILRNPETDDKDRLGFSRINRETRGGELNVYGDPAWGKVNTLLFTITALHDGKSGCPDVINDVLDFFQTYLGQEIYLHDWTGTSWRGVVTTPNERAVEDDESYWTLTFEFEGIEEPGSVPLSSMTLSHTLGMNVEWARGLTDAIIFTETISVGGDIHVSVSSVLDLNQELSGVLERTILYDNLVGGAAVTLNGKSPTTGSSTWHSHIEYLDDGTMATPVSAGAYYLVTLDSDTEYELTFDSAAVVAYEDGYACIWGFYEDATPSSTLQGSAANGAINPTCAKAVHLMREVAGGNRNNAYRRGSESDGAADTVQWTDATLRTSTDVELDLKININTTTWVVTWYAKDILDADYTQVGQASLLSNNIGAVGFSCDSVLVEQSLDYITLKELRAI